MGKYIDSDIQIRFADADCLNHINNINIQHYFEVGKIDFYKKVLGKLVGPDRESLILVSTHANFFHQTRLEDDLFVRSWCAGLGHSSVTMYQWLIDRQTGEVKADCRSVAVAFDFDRQCKIPLNEHWRELLAEYMCDVEIDAKSK